MSTIVKFKAVEIKHPVGTYITRNNSSIKAMARVIKKNYPEGSIALWCRGSSGLIIGGGIASLLSKRSIYINHVRKLGEQVHSGTRVINYCDHNIIIDDFVFSGQTVRAIVAVIKEEMYSNSNYTLDLCVTGSVKSEVHEYFRTIYCTKLQK